MTQLTTTDFQRAYPFSFTLQDDQGKPAIYIVSEDDISKQYLTLEITNTSNSPIHFPVLDQDLTEDNCHFILRFRRSAIAQLSPKGKPKISLGETSIKQSNTDQKKPDTGGIWGLQLDVDEKRPWVSIFMGRSGKATWSLMPEGKIRIKLNSITAPRGLGTRTTRVELMMVKVTIPELENGAVQNQNGKSGATSNQIVLQKRKPTREQILEVINHQGSPNIPLHAGIIGPNTLRNDGTPMEDFSMTLRLTNVSAKKTISFDELSKIHFHFFSDQNEDDHTDGAIGHKDQLKKTSFSLGTEKVTIPASSQSGEEPFWTFDFELLYAGRPHLQMAPKEFLEFKVNFGDSSIPKKETTESGDETETTEKGFITNHPQGITLLHVVYENIPDYWDGELRCPLELRPLSIQTSIENRNGTEVKKVSIDSGSREMVINALDLKVMLNEKHRLQLEESGKLILTGDENELTLGTSDPQPGLSAAEDLFLSGGNENKVNIGPSLALIEGGKLVFLNRAEINPTGTSFAWESGYRSRLEIKTGGETLYIRADGFPIRREMSTQLFIDDHGLTLTNNKAIIFEGQKGIIKVKNGREEQKMTLHQGGILEVESLQIGNTALTEDDLKNLKKLLNPTRKY